MEVNQDILNAVRMAIGKDNVKPSQFQIFKGKSAMRVQLDRPTRVGFEHKVGCLFMQVAPAKPGTGQTGYEWESKKISIKLGANDITSMIHGLRNGQPVELFHEFNDDIKTVRFSVNSERGGYFLGVEQKGTSELKVSVPLSGAEVTAFTIMLQAALPLIHNWD
jgi:hypothetical protein